MQLNPPAWHKKIIHATFALGGHRLTGADATADRYQKPQGISVMLNISAAAEADRIFRTLSECGEVQMRIRETFWALRFGMPWMINCEKPA